jgi:1-phosphatidylinositol phosphodiesterase
MPSFVEINISQSGVDFMSEQSRRKFLISASSIIAGAAVIGGGASLLQGNQAYADEISANAQGVQDATAVSPTRWMTSLPDSALISSLNIPGSHNTCARYGGASTACHNSSLADQLAAGIRCIDIRCRHFNNVFTIHHGSVYQKLTFGSGVRDVCIKFLQENPGECIIMMVKEEYKPAGNTETFDDTFQRYLSGTEQFWFLGNTIPKLGEVRGKILLVRRFDAFIPFGQTEGIAATPDLWTDNATFTIAGGAFLMVQDQYNVSTILPVSINKKWKQISNLLSLAQEDQFDDDWYMNFLSGSSAFAFPNHVAAQINPKLQKYLTSNNLQGKKIGTIMMDFAPRALINQIIALNG